LLHQHSPAFSSVISAREVATLLDDVPHRSPGYDEVEVTEKEVMAAVEHARESRRAAASKATKRKTPAGAGVKNAGISKVSLPLGSLGRANEMT
jgi:hypothetical protein